MNKNTTRRQEKEDNQYNRKYQVLTLARQILRQASGIMTMLEAVQQAEKQYDAGIRV